MRRYEVYSQFGMTIVQADRIERYSRNDVPTKIIFYADEEVMAEFYTDRICGWMELKNESSEH